MQSYEPWPETRGNLHSRWLGRVPRHFPIEDNRRLADIGRAKIAGVGDLGVEAEIVPYRPLKDLPLLTLVDLGVVVKAVRHPAVVERRPDLVGDRHPYGPANQSRCQ